MAEAARNLVCVGAKPIALTDCLNFGNPERPEVMWSFALCVEGMSEACDQFKIPVVSGNVSLYNETRGLGIYPTPIVGVLGLVEGMKAPLTAGFKGQNEVVVLDRGDPGRAGRERIFKGSPFPRARLSADAPF
ncbi:MAG: AIR synthase related protein [Candidatus Manganitrophus sp.]|nr:AIR synthase related protein [Candidatus Manganitrophus sp.]